MNRLLLLLPFFLLLLMQTACNQEPESTASFPTEYILDESPETSKMVVYQMMTRLFGNTNTTNKVYGTIEENGVGKFNDINEKALSELKQLGITHVWYTGIIEHAVIRDYSKYGIRIDDADVVKGRAGSPYAIKDYYDVNPDLAEDVANRIQEFESLIDRTHQQDLKVILDFVPNHVARAYFSDVKPEGVEDLGENDDTSKSFDPANNFYYIPDQAFQVPADYKPLGDQKHTTKDGKINEIPAKATGNDQFTATPNINDWFETVKLNYGVDYLNDRKKVFDPIPDTWLKMTAILRYWAEKGVDGFRCDMAEMVPVEFWNYAIPTIQKEYPKVVFIAEIYNPDAYSSYIDEGKFNFLYDKVQLYDTLKHIMQGTGNTANLPAIWQDLKGKNKNMLRFLENHDEQRIASPDFAGLAEKGIPAMLVSATWYSGPVMIYFGQEVGEPGAGIAGFNGEDGRTTIFDYWGVPQHQKWMNNGKFDGGGLTEDQKSLRQFYSELLNFSATSEAIAKGKLIDLQPYIKEDNTTSTKTYAFIRSYKNEHLLVLTNFDADNTIDIKLTFPSSLEQLLNNNSTFSLSKVVGKQLAIDNTQIETGTQINVSLPPLVGNIYQLKKIE